eukprot:scaffold234753_cov68-Attheya_sp.AAC.1
MEVAPSCGRVYRLRYRVHYSNWLDRSHQQVLLDHKRIYRKHNTVYSLRPVSSTEVSSIGYCTCYNCTGMALSNIRWIPCLRHLRHDMKKYLGGTPRHHRAQYICLREHRKPDPSYFSLIASLALKVKERSVHLFQPSEFSLILLERKSSASRPRLVSAGFEVFFARTVIEVVCIL